MAAKCWACTAGIGYITSTSGSVNDPLGCCSTCQSFACGHHGLRDPSGPEYICAECAPYLVAKRIATTVSAQAPQAAKTLQVVAGYYPSEEGDKERRRYPVIDLETIFRYFPEIGTREDLMRIDLGLNFVWDSEDEAREAFTKLNPGGKQLLKALVLLLKKLYQDKGLPFGYSPVLQQLFKIPYKTSSDKHGNEPLGSGA